ncbi:MAG: DinB family protein [Gemmatimonadales bacterium]
MSPLAIPRPEAEEAAPFYHGYIAEVTGDNILEQLGSQLGEVERIFASVSEAAALGRYAPGKWSVKEVLGHLADVERIFAYRLLRISRHDPTPLPGFDQNRYVPAGRFDEQTLKSLVRGFRTVRQSSIALAESIPEECWSLWGEASDKAISARALAYILVGHVAHHLRVLHERYGLGQARVPR